MTVAAPSTQSEEGPEPRLVVSLPTPGIIKDLVWSRDGKRLAVAGTRTDSIWTFEGEAATDPVQLPAERPEETPAAIAMSPDGQWLARGVPNIVELHSVEDPDQSTRLMFDDAVWSLAFSPSSRRLAVGAGEQAYLIERQGDSWSESARTTFGEDWFDGLYWRSEDVIGGLVRLRPGDRRGAPGLSVVQIAASEDGSPTVTELNRVRLEPGLQRIKCNASGQRFVAWAGGALIAGESDGTHWSILEAPDYANAAALSPDGRCVHAVTEKGDLVGLDTESGALLYRASGLGVHEGAMHVATNPANGWVAVADANGIHVYADARPTRKEPVWDLNVEESVLADRPSPVDHLGYAPYVRGVVRFLAADATKPPLTMSIEGEWGSGKSSFMLQMQRDLERRDHIAVPFNAWHHGTAEGLWAAFALDIVRVLREHAEPAGDQPERRRGLIKRVKDNLTAALVEEGQSAEKAIREYAVDLGVSLGREVIKGFPVIGGSLDKVVGRIIDRLDERRNELKARSKEMATSVDYETRLEFFAEFKRDMNAFLAAYAGERRIYVFIDDLDRCDLTMAAKLMHTLNLLMDAMPRLYFILGLDRAKVAASIAYHNRELLPYLLVTPDDQEPPDLLERRRFGYGFLEKFIQLPFVLPRPQPRDIQRYIRFLTSAGDHGGPDTERTEALPVGDAAVLLRKAAMDAGNLRTGSDFAKAARDIQTDFPGVAEPKKAITSLGSKQRADAAKQADVQALAQEVQQQESPHVQDATALVAAFLENNPRRIRHFINLYRLRVLIGAETGLFTEQADDGDPPTPMNLAKFVAICVRFPQFPESLACHPELLLDLSDAALRAEMDQHDDYAQHWGRQDGMLALFRAGCEGEAHQPDAERVAEYGLGTTSVEKLLGVAAPPRVLEQRRS